MPKTKKEILASIRKIKAGNAQLLVDIESYNVINPRGDWIDPRYDIHRRINEALDECIKAMK